MSRWETSQLDGGRFSEAVLRLIEFKNTGHFTSLGRQIKREVIINSVKHNTSIPDSLRLQIPNLVALIMDFRNSRNVGHLGTIDVNEMDSTFVIQSVNWIMAELVRIEGQTSPDEAQEAIKKIIERKIPIVEEIGGRLKVLNPKLTVREQILVICYQKYSGFIEDKNLFEWVEEKNKTRFKKYLILLDKEKLVDYYNKKICLTKLGLVWVEKNIKFQLDLSGK